MRIASVLATGLLSTGTVAVQAAGAGPAYRVGAPSAVRVGDLYWLAYRCSDDDGTAVLLASSEDGSTFHPVARATAAELGFAESAELGRPALVHGPDGRWWLYLDGSGVLTARQSSEPAGLLAAPAMPLSFAEPSEAVPDASGAFDALVRCAPDGWQLWATRDVAGEQDQPRRPGRSTWFATSADGVHWSWQAPALAVQRGRWDADLARVTAVLAADGGWLAFYDGRSGAAEIGHERPGVAFGPGPGTLRGSPHSLLADDPRGLQQLSVVELATGFRLFVEAERPDGAHDLLTSYVARPFTAPQEFGTDA